MAMREESTSGFSFSTAMAASTRDADSSASPRYLFARAILQEVELDENQRRTVKANARCLPVFERLGYGRGGGVLGLVHPRGHSNVVS